MITNKRDFTIGLVLMITFFLVLVYMFLPVFHGQNGLNYLDSLYNSISKGSADYIPKLRKESGELLGREVSVTLALDSEAEAEQVEPLFVKSGAAAERSGAELKVQGDLGAILGNCLDDSAEMFGNRGEAVQAKDGAPEKAVLFHWWKALKALEKQLKKQERFADATVVGNVEKRGVECAYNYYKIVPEKISAKAGTVVLSLVFYVVYTMWYGFGFLYLFQGLGFRLEH